MERFGSRRTELFFILESFIYINFFILDITRQEILLSGIFKYVGIFFCAVYVWSAKEAVSSWKQRIFKWIYGFLLVADCFLLFTENYLPGLFAFLCVQGLYSYYLSGRERKKMICQVVICLIITAFVLFLLLFFGVEIDVVLKTAIFYFSCFSYNLCKLLISYHHNKEAVFLTIGFILYFLCDLNVGIYQASSYLDFEMLNHMTKISGLGMWLFYLPGQVFIAYSAASEK